MAAVQAPGPSLDAGLGLAEKRAPLPDGRSLRIVVAGIENPLVIFEAGIGMAASMWGTVQPLLAAETRALAYDRAGLGGDFAGMCKPTLLALEGRHATTAAYPTRRSTGPVPVGPGG